MKLPPSVRSTTPWSSWWSASTPVSRTATAIEWSPVVRRHAEETFIRSSSHWKRPCHGSATGSCASEAEPFQRSTPRRRSAPWSAPSRVSGKTVVTERFASIRALKLGERGTTASASIALRSVTTTPPAAVTTARICAGVVPGKKRTTVTPNGLPAAEAEPAKAHAATNAARRRPGRITVACFGAHGRLLHHSIGKDEGRPKAALVNSVPARRSRVLGPGQVDVLFDRPAEAPGVRPKDQRAALRVSRHPHVVAEEAGLDRVVRHDQVRHRRRRDAGVLKGRRGRGRLPDRHHGDVVAAGRLAVAVGAVVVADEELLAV